MEVQGHRDLLVLKVEPDHQVLKVTLESEVTKVPLALKVLQVAMVIKAIREISGHLVTLGYLVIQVKMEPKGTPEKKANVAAMVREVNLGKRVASAQLAIQEI